jgi:diguanylate cyclase (GGDEF)-like protein/PAS domain S-box-containing protein
MIFAALTSDRESQLRGLLDAIQEFIVLKDGEGRWLITNKIVLDTYHLQGVDYVGKTDMELALIRPELHDAFVYNIQTDEQAWQKKATLRIQKSFMGLDGHINTWEVIKTPTFDEAGNRHQLVIVSRNITERRIAEQALETSEQRYRLIADNMFDIIGVFKPEVGIEYVSPSFEHVLGHRAAVYLGSDLFELIHPDDNDPLRRAFRLLLDGTASHTTIECRCLHAQGHYIWFEANLSSTYTAEGRLDNVVFSCRDISTRKAYNEHLQALAYHDPLTGAPNRRFLMDQAQLMIDRVSAGSTFAVLYLDLDRFKPINDEMGHEMGDELLTQFACRLRQHLRTDDVYARIGGDEFVIVLAHVNEAQAVMIAERLCLVLQEPWSLPCGELKTTSSIGVALYPDAGLSVHTLLRHADEALYQAKRAGRACIMVHKK